MINQQSDKLDFLIVHDNKQPNQGSLAIISLQGKNQPEYLPLNWPNEKLPTDLEALTSIPDTKNSDFIAVKTHGKASNFQLDCNKKSLSILKEFDLPAITKDSNFESSCLQEIDNQLIAIWGHAGEREEPARIYCGKLNLTKYQITNIDSATFKVAYPGGNVLHICDLRIDNAGIVYIPSANDPGNDGLFQSAVYVPGYLGFYSKKMQWRPNQQLFSIYRVSIIKLKVYFLNLVQHEE